jgi:hypothetical protein
MWARYLGDRRIRLVAQITGLILLIGLGVIGAYSLPGIAGDDDGGNAALGDGAGAGRTPGALAVDLNGSPSPGPTRSAKASAQPSATTGPGPVATTAAPPSYPKTTDAYARAVLNAWLAHNGTRLDQLANPGSITLMGTAPSGLAGGWEFYACYFEPLSPCRELRNDAGDVFGVKVDPTKLGKAKAVTGVWIDRTKYPSTPKAYWSYVIDTWGGQHNEERLAMLTDGQAVGFFGNMKPYGDHTAYKSETYVEFTSGADPDNRVCISVYDTSPQSAGWHFGVDKRLLGKKHALVFANGSETGPYC